MHFSHNITVVGLLNSLAQALCRHSWTSSFQPPTRKRQVVIIVVVDIFFGWTPWLDPSPLPFKFDISLPNAILTTQRYFGVLVGPLALAFQRRDFAP